MDLGQNHFHPMAANGHINLVGVFDDKAQLEFVDQKPLTLDIASAIRFRLLRPAYHQEK